MSNIIISGQQFNNINKITFNTPGGTLATFLVEGYEPPVPDAPTFNRIFSENSPEVISYYSDEIAKNNYTSSQVAEIYGWNLGDIIPITLSNDEIIEMQIIGINHDTLSSNHVSKAGLTFLMKNCLQTLYPMNIERQNIGGYAASEMKIETLPTIKDLLPQKWQDVIKLVDKKSASDTGETLTLSEDLFLLSEIELTNSSSYAISGDTEGNQYEYFSTISTETDRIKNQGNTESPVRWWLRSVTEITQYIPASFCSTNTSGRVTTYRADQLAGVAFAFCV